MSDSATVNLGELDTSELLSQLRDIQEPLAPEGTSLWIILMTFVLATALVCLFWWQRHRGRYAFRKEALTRVDVIATNAQSKTGNTSSPLFDLARLLRQLMRHRRGDTINSLDGKQWLTALDDEFASEWFSHGRGQVFGNTIYQNLQLSTPDFTLLCDELKHEIRRLKPQSS